MLTGRSTAGCGRRSIKSGAITTLSILRGISLRYWIKLQGRSHADDVRLASAGNLAFIENQEEVTRNGTRIRW